MKKKNTKSQNNNTMLWIIFFLVITVALFIFLRLQKNSYDANREELKPIAASLDVGKYNIYKSKQLKITLRIPKVYKMTDKFKFISLTSEQGEILVSTNGSYFNNIEEHLKLLAKLNHLIYEDKKSLIVNNYEAIFTIIKGKDSGEEERSYFIYPDKSTWTIYSISTKSKDLYKDLDQIAQSFQYTP